MESVETLPASLREELRALADPVRAVQEKRYLKSDLVHWGVTVPALRKAVKGVLARVPGLDREGLLRFDEHLLEPLTYAELVLPADARQSIRRIAEQPAA